MIMCNCIFMSVDFCQLGSLFSEFRLTFNRIAIIEVPGVAVFRCLYICCFQEGKARAHAPVPLLHMEFNLCAHIIDLSTQ